jgi:hypothetical protein
MSEQPEVFGWPPGALQEISAVLEARAFLARVCDPRQTPRVSRAVRGEARALLRRYPPVERLRPVLQGSKSLLDRRETGQAQG